MYREKISVERKLSNASLDEVVIEKNQMVKDLGGAWLCTYVRFYINQC